MDDSSFYRKIISDLLVSYGAEVSIFNDGVDAYKELKENLTSYDFLVTDIEMPIMDGLELAEKVRALSDGNKLPILAVSTLEESKSPSENFSGRIKKFDQGVFLNQVSSLID